MTGIQGFRSGTNDDGTTWVSWLQPDGSRYTATAHGSTITAADEDIQGLHDQVTQLQDRVTQQQDLIDSLRMTIDELEERLRNVRRNRQIPPFSRQGGANYGP